MPDPFSRVQPGQPLKVDAGLWNQVLDLVRREVRTRLGDQGAGAVGLGVTPAAVVLIRNDTGDDQTQGHVYRVGEPLLTVGPDFWGKPAFEGLTPVSATDTVAIARDPLASGALGQAVIMGVAVADVNVTDPNHTFAVPIAADGTKLASAACGSIRILRPVPGLGVRTHPVLVGVPVCQGEAPTPTDCDPAWVYAALEGEDLCVELRATSGPSCYDGAYHLEWDGGTWVYCGPALGPGADQTDFHLRVLCYPGDVLRLNVSYALSCGALGAFADNQPIAVDEGPPFAGTTTVGWEVWNDPASECQDAPVVLAATVSVYDSETCCLSIEGWDGPGWYCVQGDGEACEAAELLEEDRCDSEIVICSGPYETEAEALAACPPVTECPTDPLCVVVESDGDCPEIEGEYPVTFNPALGGSGGWNVPTSAGSFFTSCEPDGWVIRVNSLDEEPYAGPIEGPLPVVFTGVSLAGCGDPMTITVKSEACCTQIAGWDGPGWYCVEGEPIELFQSDACDDSIVIDSGPYETQEDAEVDCPGTPPPSSPQTFTESGTWEVPSGVTSVTAECWGAGGGGGGGNGNAAHGGGGGAYARKTITVTPLDTLTVTVGTGGAGGVSTAAGSAGGASWFSGIGTVNAPGGGGGSGFSCCGGAGGIIGIGDVSFIGGDGADRDGSTPGGGGSSAGTAANGTDAVDDVGAIAPTGGGNGGDAPGGAGANGFAPGGGGGGRTGGSTAGSGADGKVVLTW